MTAANPSWLCLAEARIVGLPQPRVGSGHRRQGSDLLESAYGVRRWPDRSGRDHRLWPARSAQPKFAAANGFLARSGGVLGWPGRLCNRANLLLRLAI